MPRLVRDDDAAVPPAAAAAIPAKKTTQPLKKSLEKKSPPQETTNTNNSNNKDDGKTQPPSREATKKDDLKQPPNKKRVERKLNNSNIDDGKQPLKQPPKQKRVTSKPVEKVVIPPPPPGVPEIQLRMWSSTLRLRMQHLKQLPPEQLSGLAYDIKDDLKTSRYGKNEYSAALAIVLRKSRENNVNNDSGAEDTDLATGRYSSLYLQQEISPEAIGRHCLALFYRSIDHRLPPAMNKYGLDALRRAFSSLDKWRKNGDKEMLSRRKRKSDGGRESNNDKAKKSRGSDETPAPVEEQTRKGPAGLTPTLVNVTAKSSGAQSSTVAVSNNDQLLDKHQDVSDANVNDVEMEDPSSSQIAVDKENQTNGVDDKAMDPLTLSSTSKVTENKSASQNSNENEQSLQSHVASSNDTAIDPPARNATAEQRGDAPKNSNQMITAVNSNPIESAKPHDDNGLSTLPSSDTAQSELRIVSNDVEEGISAAVGKPSALNRSSNDNSNKIDAAKATTSVLNEEPLSLVVPAGYRRRMLNNCHIYDCPNKGGKCDLHGQLALTCKTEGCNKFRVRGYDVCKQHGAKNPNHCKVTGCTKNRVSNGLCSDHCTQVSSSEDRTANQSQAVTKTSVELSSGDQVTNQSQAASIASVEPQVLAIGQLQAAFNEVLTESQSSPINNDLPVPSTTVPSESSLKQEISNGLQSGSALDNAPSKTTPTSNGDGEGTQHNNVANALIDLTADSPAKEPPSKQHVSPPPSPPPTTMIRNPPPSPKPRPPVFSDIHQVLFCPDVVTDRHTMSGCVKDYARAGMFVQFDRGYHLDGSGNSMDHAQCIDVKERLSTWDPYWRIVDELGHLDVPVPSGKSETTSVGTRTTACVPIPYNPLVTEYASIHSCAAMYVDFPLEISRSKCSHQDGKGRNVEGFRPWGVKWGKNAQADTNHQSRERRLLLRCVPLRRTAAEKKKRADLHLWPLGSFVQLKLGNGNYQVIPVVQRKQQSHDHRKWLGNSRPLDLTRYIPDMNHSLEINICSKEVIESASGEEGGVNGLKNSYAVTLAICEYIDPDTLYNELMGVAEGGEVLMPKLSLRAAKRMLKECISKNTITLDSDEEEGDGKAESESDFLTFSLLCHASKTCIETPVRGQQCTHLQCFDLRNYLNMNNVVSAGRWRCPYCENFVSVRDLVHCGLFQAILDDLRGKLAPGVRDSVCVKADGSWHLIDENKVRSKKSDAGLPESMDVEGDKAGSGEPEVIELV